MIIKKITIENYLCYCGIKEFELANGLNIILGENGEGKTAFFEAIEWLFNGDSRNLDLRVSAKALADVEVHDEFRVRVAMTVEQYDEKRIISKAFVVKKISEKDCSTSNFEVGGVEENKNGERTVVDGRVLLDSVFPPEIRKYSVFKGEAELNIFKNEDALITLINSFSNAKFYDKYASKGAFLREKAEKAVDDETRRNNRNQQEYNRLEVAISELEREKSTVQVHLASAEGQVETLDESIKDAEKFVSNATALETINGRITNLESKMASIRSRIDENYTTALFDEQWILVNFESIHKEFASKVTAFSTEKRKLQSQFDREKGVKDGKKQMKAELLNHAVPLPVGVPSKAIMEEMLKDHVCKVCNTPAPEGSDAYVFMEKRLKDYLKSQKPEKKEEDEETVLFKNDYTHRLVNLSSNHEDYLSNLRQIHENITALFEFNQQRREELEELEAKMKEEIAEREKIIGSSTLGEDKLTNVLKNYNSWQRQLRTFNQDVDQYKLRLQEIADELKSLKDEKDNIDNNNANGFLLKTRNILRDIEVVFKDTKKKKFDEFVSLLEIKSNEIFDQINLDSFTGKIRIQNKLSTSGKMTVRIDLEEDDGTPFHRPNQSLLTSMHLSILFAISKIASELRNENFPMIFDAPMSSFGENKTTQFLNLIYETNNQRILLIKDFLNLNRKTQQLSIKADFDKIKRHKAFWIRLERPFDKHVLKTLNTQVIPV